MIVAIRMEPVSRGVRGDVEQRSRKRGDRKILSNLLLRVSASPRETPFSCDDRGDSHGNPFHAECAETRSRDRGKEEIEKFSATSFSASPRLRVKRLSVAMIVAIRMEPVSRGVRGDAEQRS